MQDELKAALMQLLTGCTGSPTAATATNWIHYYYYYYDMASDSTNSHSYAIILRTRPASLNSRPSSILPHQR